MTAGQFALVRAAPCLDCGKANVHPHKGSHVLTRCDDVGVPCAPTGNSYNDAERCIAAGYDNGDVKLFDLRWALVCCVVLFAFLRSSVLNMGLVSLVCRTNTMRWETNVGNGVVGLEFDRKDIEMNKVRGRGLQLSL